MSNGSCQNLTEVSCNEQDSILGARTSWAGLMVSLSLVTLLLYPSPAFPQAPNRPTLSPYEINLTTHILPVLPFDMPYELKVIAAKETTKVRVRYMVKEKDTCSLAWSAKPKAQCPSPHDKLTQSASEYDSGCAAAVQTGEVATAILGMPELEANTSLCFHFDLQETLSETTLSKVQKAAGESIDKIFGALEMGKSVPESFAPQLQKQICDALAAAAPVGVTPNFSPGGLCGNTFMSDAVKAAFYRSMIPVLEGQTNRLANLEQVRKATDNTRAAIDVLAAAVRSLDSKIRSAVEPALVTLMSAKAGLAYGQLVSAWHSADVASYAAVAGGVLENVVKVGNAIGGDEATKIRPQLEGALAQCTNLAAVVEAFRLSLDKRDNALSGFAKEFGALVQRYTTIELSPIDQDFSTRAALYISVDLGVAHAWDVSKTFTYAGINVYLRPINKQAPLRRGQSDYFRRRFSFMVGASISDFADTARGVQGVLGGRAVLTAAGWRLLDSVRISAGGVWVTESNHNPLIARTRTSITPFAALSLDWDARSTFTTLTSALTGR